MEENGECVVEWKIQNFSCWSSDLHGEKITSPYCPFFGSEIRLYPRGSSGKGEYILVVVENEVSRQGDLSIGLVGSIMCTTEINLKNGTHDFVLSKFEDVLAQVKKNEPVCEDYVILRFRLGCTKFSKVLCMSTTIDVFIVTIKLPVLELKKDNMLWISYPCKDAEGLLNLKVERCEGKTQILLGVYDRELVFTVHSFLDFQSNEGTCILHEEKAHVFCAERIWALSDSLNLEELMEKSLTIHLRLKIIFSSMSRNLKTFYVSTCFVTNDDFDFSRAKSSKSKNLESSVEVLGKDIMNLYLDKDFSDLQLQCGGESFAAHKNILCARSPFFKRTLSSETIESTFVSADIVDLDSPTLTRFLTFLYSGSAQDLQWENAIKLYYAAKKYEVQTLKQECVSVLCSSVSVSNVCEILVLADEHKDTQITSAVHEFIVNNFNAVLESEEWQRRMKTNSYLLLKTLTILAGKVTVKKR